MPPVVTPGQCGNQRCVRHPPWKPPSLADRARLTPQLGARILGSASCAEHGHQQGGHSRGVGYRGRRRKDVFSTGGRRAFISRAPSLSDLEPRVRPFYILLLSPCTPSYEPSLVAEFSACKDKVITKILSSSFRQLYNPENIFLSKDGGGRREQLGTRLLLGERFTRTSWRWLIERQGKRLLEVGFSRRAPSYCESAVLQGFMLMHSIAGGTGLGLGSFLLRAAQTTSSQKKLIQTYSRVPNAQEGDVVVQPYNAMLSSSAQNHADSVVRARQWRARRASMPSLASRDAIV